MTNDNDLTALFEERMRKHKRRKLGKKAGGGVTKSSALQLVSAAQNHQSAYQYYQNLSKNARHRDFSESRSWYGESSKSYEMMKRPAAYTVLDVLEKEDKGSDNFFAKVRDKVQVDGLTQEIEKGVFQDNQSHFGNLVEQVQYVKKTREIAIANFEGDEAAYLASAQGNALEVNLAETEEKVMKEMATMDDNFNFYYKDV